MKKKKLKLSLKKLTISNLQSEAIVGGQTGRLCDSDYCPRTVDTKCCPKTIGCPTSWN